MKNKPNLKPLPFWNAYGAGVLLGTTLFFAFFLTGRGLGGSGAMDRITAFFYELFSPVTAYSYNYYDRYFTKDIFVLNDYSLYQLLGVLAGGYISASFGRRSHLTIEKGPRIAVQNRLILAFAGGAIMALGARLARGCTSGQMLTGGATLAVGSWVMFAFFFGGAYLIAWTVRKQWI